MSSQSYGLWMGLILITAALGMYFTFSGSVPHLGKLEKEKMSETQRDNTRQLQQAGRERETQYENHKKGEFADELQPYQENVVPNIVHYIWIGQRPFQFHNLVSLASAKRFLKPEKIMFHTNVQLMINTDNMDFQEGVGSGGMWKEAKSIPGLEVVHFTPTESINNLTLDRKSQHYLSRIQILKQYGGIYLDDDVIVIDSFDPLRKYACVIGREKTGLNTGVMLAKGKTVFLDEWEKTFEKYGSDRRSAEDNLYWLISKHPETIHVEAQKFRRHDNFQNDDYSNNIFLAKIDHFGNYAVKLYYELYYHENTGQNIKYVNSSYGALARYAYYGAPEFKQDWPPKETKPLVVPNIVHYVWFSDHDFLFHHFLSIKSALHIQKAESIMFHTDAEPRGKWWDKAKKMAGDKLSVMYKEQPTEAFGRALPKLHHRSDIARLHALLKYGGIFIEEDTLIVKSLDTIRHFPFTMGMDVYGLNNGVILSEQNAEFLRFYHDSYQFFNDAEEHFNSAMEPYHIGADHPDSLNVEEIRLTRPDWTDFFDMARLWRENGKRDWSHSLTIQLKWIYHDKTYEPEDILDMDTTFGEIARLVYFGSPEIITEGVDIEQFEKGFYKEDGHEHRLEKDGGKKEKLADEEMAARKDENYIREVGHPHDKHANNEVVQEIDLGRKGEENEKEDIREVDGEKTEDVEVRGEGETEIAKQRSEEEDEQAKGEEEIAMEKKLAQDDAEIRDKEKKMDEAAQADPIKDEEKTHDDTDIRDNEKMVDEADKPNTINDVQEKIV